MFGIYHNMLAYGHNYLRELMWIFSVTVKKHLRDAKAFMCFSGGAVITKELVVVKSYKP